MDQIWVRTGITEDGLAGAEWERIPGLMVQLSLYERSVSWAVDRDHRLWMRGVRIGSDPDPVPNDDVIDPDCQANVETTIDGQVWMIDCQDNLYFRYGITEQLVLGERWVFVDSNVQYVAANGQGELWAVKNNDELYVRTGVTPSNPLGHSWKYVFSYINRVSSTNGYGLWAIDSRDQSVYHRGVEALEWTGFNDQAVKMAGHWFKVEDSDMSANRHLFVYGVEKDIWSVNAEGSMQYRMGITP